MSILETKDKIFANALNLIPSLGAVKLVRLLKHFGTWERAWEAGAHELSKAGIDEKTITQIISEKTKFKPEQSFEALQKENIEILTIDDSSYPKLLAEITAPPAILYFRGDKQILNNSNLSVVGSRKMTNYGKQVIAQLIPDLVLQGLQIVSGLAYGVDAEALNSCLNNNGKAIAVLPGSIDDRSISPRANFNLAKQIIEIGVLISEYPLNTLVQIQNFPIRNRIIAGLSLGTLVIEAPVESGSLITANYALEQNREVFAVPGSIFSEPSLGTNNLIKKGASLVTTAADILQGLNLDIQLSSKKELPELSLQEKLIYDNLSFQPIHIEELTKEVNLPASVVSSQITMLELKGLAKNLGNGNYAKMR